MVNRTVTQIPQDIRMSETSAYQSAYQNTILLVEDNAINRLLIGRMLENQGHAVIMAANGLEAVEIVTANAPTIDVVLMDIQMPGLNGKDASRSIRAYEARHQCKHRVPIIALTADSLPEDIADCMSSGMDAHVPKPIHWPRLFSAIQKVTATRSAPTSRSG